MPPKKDEKKAKPSATKIVADKVRLCPHYLLKPISNASNPDLWHEKCEQACRSLSVELGITTAPLALADLRTNTEKRSTGTEANPSHSITSRSSQDARSETKRSRESPTRKGQSCCGTSEARNRGTVQACPGTESAIWCGPEDGGVHILQAGELREGQKMQV